MKIQTVFKLGCVGWIFFILIDAAIAVAIIYVIVHFILKLW